MDGQMVDFYLKRFCDPSTKCQNCSDEQEKPGEMEEIFLKVLWLSAFLVCLLFVCFCCFWFGFLSPWLTSKTTVSPKMALNS